jgi:hypothetical protein
MRLILDAAKKYTTPLAVQKFLAQLPYNSEKQIETLCSAEESLKRNTAHCLEAAFIAAAILEQHGHEPFVLSMESHDYLDHVVYLFRQGKNWGTIGRSRDRGLHGRKPVFRSIKQLVQSYFAPYVDKTGRIVRYEVFHLDETQSAWRDSTQNLWQVERYLGDQKHLPFNTSDKTFKKIRNSYLKKGPLTKGENWWP